MNDEIRAFADANGLSQSVADDLISLLSRPGESGTWSGTLPTRDQASGEASVVGESAAESQAAPAEGWRYEDLGPLGAGGMGEVRRVRDRHLDRVVAMKTLHRPVGNSRAAVARFQAEARASGRLQHPNLIPVYDLGVLPDGRPWFTMREVQGRTLGDVIAELHAADPPSDGWTLRRTVGALATVCRAVAYAHSQGTVHRDLKPDNVMVGSLGEIYLLDWGIAKLMDAAESAGSSVVGTPAFMPPEQARGQSERVGAHSDVYALGAILYAILSGGPPYRGVRSRAVVGQVVAGPPPVLTASTVPLRPAELIEVCERAMAREPEDRFPGALELAAALDAWLDGVRLRAQAEGVARRALERVDEARELLGRAAALRRESEALLRDVEPWRPEQDKIPGWDRLADAQAADGLARRVQLEVDQGLYAALRIAPDLEVAHAALAERLRARHANAEAARDAEGMVVAELPLRRHTEALPLEHPTRVSCAAYLSGDGALTLVTEPAGARVRLFRFREQNRRLVEVFERDLGLTPLVEVGLAMGSYVCSVEHPDCDPVRYPVHIGRLGHTDGVPPGGSDPHPVWLPPRGTFAADEIYVPAGWFQAGGDGQTFRGQPARRLWCDGLVVARFPVTNERYIAFLDDLVRQGREDEALFHAPRERAASEGGLGGLLYGRTSSGGFELQTDADGDRWDPRWPVFHLDWHGAQAFYAWWAERTGRPWRLPGELEWEKAARGVDGRFFPWGDEHDPSWCCMFESHRDRPLPQVVDSFPVDVSVYGVRGVAGNVRDWCGDVEGRVVDQRVLPPDPEQWAGDDRRRVRGGSWFDAARNTRVANRDQNKTGFRVAMNGFRGSFRVADL